MDKQTPFLFLMFMLCTTYFVYGTFRFVVFTFGIWCLAQFFLIWWSEFKRRLNEYRDVNNG